MNARLPMQPEPKRGSSPAKPITSIDRAGAKPASRSRRTAAIAPSTPTTPS